MLFKNFFRFFKNDESASSGEHILMGGLIMVAVVLTYNNLSSNLNLALQKASNSVNGVTTTTTGVTTTTTGVTTTTTGVTTTTGAMTTTTTGMTTTTTTGAMTTTTTTTAMTTTTTTGAMTTTTGGTGGAMTTTTTGVTTTTTTTGMTTTTTTGGATTTTTTGGATTTTGGATTTTGGATTTTTCLPFDVEIKTLTAQKRVSDIKVGDIVLSDGGKPARVIRINRVVVGKTHKIMKISFTDGTVLRGSLRHPTADGKMFGDLKVGDSVDGKIITELKLLPYTNHNYTYDILTDSRNGNYYADGVLIGSTLKLENIATVDVTILKPSISFE